MSWLWVHVCGDFAPVNGTVSWQVVTALFLAGLGGGVTHCLTMCSVFVLGQQSEGLSPLARMLLPYHAGRITTYAGLGALAGAGFGLFSATGGFPVIRHMMLALAAVLFLAILAERLLAKAGVRMPLRLGFAGCALKGVAQMRRMTQPLQRYGLGLVMGLLPCPLILAATTGAAATASPVAGALAMAAFGVGTTPTLAGLAFAKSNLLTSSPKVRDMLTLAALALNSVILLTLAVGTGASGA
ncbi:MAG: sulfite exporter TauE/SafE family protein [Asticcacaulis sp.]|nr:sulfite exporter TauE/SafE family protein [Asticcacaulis sp.]